MPVPVALVEVELHTDAWGSETTWELTDTVSGDLIASGGPYTFITSPELGALFTSEIPVTACDCFDFTIFDSYGDGICCASEGETTCTCPSDCGGPGTCGDSICCPTEGETGSTCPSDCSGPGNADCPVVCHKGRTLTVSESSVPAHLAHGDTCGPCE
ncbi:MAG: hypothetical protein IH987_21745 [Planctomycetes bacterium]|nr:hypothetical protein [Planctomycetota bacterium]